MVEGKSLQQLFQFQTTSCEIIAAKLGIVRKVLRYAKKKKKYLNCQRRIMFITPRQNILITYTIFR